MHIASPLIAAAPPTTPPAAPPANANVTVIVTSVIHDTDASCHGGQHRNGQPGPDPAGQNIQRVHAGQPFWFDFHIGERLHPQFFPWPWGEHLIQCSINQAAKRILSAPPMKKAKTKKAVKNPRLN
jgi:hypothetical protein